MATKLWIRAENKPLEQRAPVVPDDAAKLIAAGYRVTVERSAQRAVDISRYADVGCEIAAENSWPEAPRDAFILGVKELSENTEPLVHRHIHFGHVFKGQPGWRDVLRNFVTGGGALYDLECLVDESGRRIAAFGYWAGYAGAAVGVKTWCGQQARRSPPLAGLRAYPNKQDLIDELQVELSSAIADAGRKPDVIVIGALGRSGGGAVDLAEQLGLTVTKWDMAETSNGGPFPQILEHDIFVNCVLASSVCPRFVDPETVAAPGRRLGVIADVSCDPGSAYNPIPIYDKCTTFDQPVLRAIDSDPVLDVTAIDHLPSMLPMESSEDYSHQLLPALLALDKPDEGVWARAFAEFKTHSESI